MRTRRIGFGSRALVVALIGGGYLVIGVKNSDVADAGITTNQAAPQAGAPALPADSNLKIEPK